MILFRFMLLRAQIIVKYQLDMDTRLLLNFPKIKRVFQDFDRLKEILYAFTIYQPKESLNYELSPDYS